MPACLSRRLESNYTKMIKNVGMKNKSPSFRLQDVPFAFFSNNTYPLVGKSSKLNSRNFSELIRFEERFATNKKGNNA